MIYSSNSPVTFNNALSDNYDVVVIGGGIIGISTAWFLNRSGLRVAVCEKGRVAGEQSSRNWGWVRQQGRDEAELPIMMESNRIWQKLAEQVGTDLGFRQHGAMYIAETDEEIVGYESWVRLAASHGLVSKLLTPADVRERVKGLTGDWKGAVVTPSDGRAEPAVAVPAIASACQRNGVDIAEDCAVRGIVTAAGKLSGVVTERGEVRCGAAVCAGGAWSSLLMSHVGYRFPQLSVKSTVVRTAATADIYMGNAACDDFALRRREDGGYSIAPADFNEHLISLDSLRYMLRFMPMLRDNWSKTRLRFGDTAPGGLLASSRWQEDSVTPFERSRVLNPVPSRATLKLIRTLFEQRLPALADVPFVESWAGMIDSTPDVVPVIDQMPNTSGLFLASGFSGHGFGIGPGAGRVIADMVQGNEVGHDLSRFRFSRFSDGSKLRPGPTI